MSVVEMKNLSFKPGMELKVTGVPKPNAANFSINVGHSEKVIALHLDSRFNRFGDHRTFVLNSNHHGSWKEEQRERNFRLQPGKQFEVTISFTNDSFYINVHDGNMIRFPNRFGEKQYDYFFVTGDVIINGVHLK